MDNYVAGVISGIVTTLIVGVVLFVIFTCHSNDCKDKLTIKYINNEKTYERKIAADMVESSSIWTNFVNRKTEMNSSSIEWTFSNPRSK